MRGTVIVIGAAGGVGGAVAKALVDRRVDVVGSVLNEAEEQLALANAPGIRRLVRMDLSQAQSVSDAMDALLADPALKRVAAVVICAAISPFGPVELMPVDALRNTLEINTFSNITIYQKAMPWLRRSKGRFVITSSMAGKIGIPFIGHYAASKHALEALADVMRLEAADFGVHVVLVEPGSVKTTMVVDQPRLVDEAIARLTPEQKKLFGKRYARWKEITGGAWQTAYPPETVSRAVMKALTAKTPQTRYVTDPVAKQMIAQKKRLSDRAFDRFVMKMLG